MLNMLTTSLRLTFWSHPSAVLVVGTYNVDIVEVFHIIPENGTLEQFSRRYNGSVTRGYGATDLSRELLGSATVYGNDENMENLVEGLKKRIPELLTQSRVMDIKTWRTATRVSRLVDEVLRPAGLEALKEREERTAHSIGAVTGQFSVYLILVKRPRPGPLRTYRRLTSFPDRLW